MTTKGWKAIGGAAFIGAALLLSMGPAPADAATKKESGDSGSAKTLMLTFPKKKENFGPGIYVFEGQIGKGKSVKVSIDGGETTSMKADADGAYRYEAKVTKPGDHDVKVVISGGGLKEPVTETMDFEVLEGAKTEELVAKVDERPTEKSDEDLPVGLLPEDDGSDVAISNDNGLGTNEVPVKDKVIAEQAKGKPAQKTKPKVNPKVKPKPAQKIAAKSGAKFAISSHTNFNVVPHGVINVGGKRESGR